MGGRGSALPHTALPSPAPAPRPHLHIAHGGRPEVVEERAEGGRRGDAGSCGERHRVRPSFRLRPALLRAPCSSSGPVSPSSPALLRPCAPLRPPPGAVRSLPQPPTPRVPSSVPVPLLHAPLGPRRPPSGLAPLLKPSPSPPPPLYPRFAAPRGAPLTGGRGGGPRGGAGAGGGRDGFVGHPRTAPERLSVPSGGRRVGKTEASGRAGRPPPNSRLVGRRGPPAPIGRRPERSRPALSPGRGDDVTARTPPTRKHGAPCLRHHGDARRPAPPPPSPPYPPCEGPRPPPALNGRAHSHPTAQSFIGNRQSCQPTTPGGATTGALPQPPEGQRRPGEALLLLLPVRHGGGSRPFSATSSAQTLQRTTA